MITKSFDIPYDGNGAKFVLNQYTDKTVSEPWYTLTLIVDTGAGTYSETTINVDPRELSNNILNILNKLENKKDKFKQPNPQVRKVPNLWLEKGYTT